LLPAYAAAFAIVAVALLQLDLSAQKSAGTWSVVMNVSGGIAGLDREIRVANDGAFTATDLRRRTTANGQLPAALLVDADAIVGKLSPVVSRPSADCRDCLVYRFEITRAGATTLTADFNDISVVGTPFEPLVKILTTPLTDALRP
jgi:hypothetical protein